MLTKTLLKKLLGVEGIVIENTDFDKDNNLIIRVRPIKRLRCRCGKCGKRAPIYDGGNGKRLWRSLDFGSTKVYLESDAPRVYCKEHGVTVVAFPWARHDSWFTRTFECQVGWLAKKCTKSAITELMRIEWKTVGAIVKRVYDDLERAAPCRFDGLVRIGIDETSYKRGHKYMTVIVNHDTNAVIWCAIGHGKNVLDLFFEGLSDSQLSSIKLVSADGARWIADCIEQWCPYAERCVDPFHVVSWATDALDDIRKGIWRDVHKEARSEPKRGRGRPRKDAPKTKKDEAKEIKKSRYSLLKNPENLTVKQQATLDLIAQDNNRLWRAYRLKEDLRLIFRLPHAEAKGALDTWLSWAQRCRIEEFVELGRKIKRHYEAILKTLESGLSNARIESMNNKIKVLIKMAYGFRNVDNMLAMVMLTCSNLPLKLPGR